MKPTMAELLAALLAVFEGEKLKAYADSGGVWTIGFGHTVGVVEGMESTHEQNIGWLKEDSAPLLRALAGHPVLEGGALASFGYNCGKGALQKVLLAADTIDNARHTQDRHGTVLAGLVARRRLEGMLIALGK